jgi:hypothetical protein
MDFDGDYALMLMDFVADFWTAQFHDEMMMDFEVGIYFSCGTMI